MTTEAHRELKTDCRGVLPHSRRCPHDWIEPRGRRDGNAGSTIIRVRPIASSPCPKYRHFRLEPSRAYHPGSPSNECFPDSPRFREAVAACARAIGRLSAEGVLIHDSGGYRLAAPWVDLIAACEGAPADGRGGAEHCGRCHERV